MSQKNRPTSKRDEEALMDLLWEPIRADKPRNFIMTVYPWGEANTPLHDTREPRAWQIDEWEKMGDHIASNRILIVQRDQKKEQLLREFKKQNIDPIKQNLLLKQELEPLQPRVYQSATASGRGPGKSAFLAMTDHWFLSVVLGGTAIITANTETQLKSKTWPEFKKWLTLSINSHWFEPNAMSIRPAAWFKETMEKQLKIDAGYYYAEAQTWDEKNPDAFAGAHNTNGFLSAFDEASGIPKAIWTVEAGFFTEPTLHRYRFRFSNPRRNSGEFFECFHKNRKFWHRRNLDSRTVEGTDTAVLNQIIEEHGEDSDEARIEVKGQFPRQGDNQFIPRGVVDEAVKRDLPEDIYAPLIMGVDPARFGDDKTVIRFRLGRRANVIPPVKISGMDNMKVANMCASLIEKYNPDAVCIDAGNGTGIIDRLRELKYKVYEVWFGADSPDPQYVNMRTYLWAQMGEWLTGGAIDNDSDLITDLTAPGYKFQTKSDRKMLESKDDLKARGFDSPDDADALACTFFAKVARKDRVISRGTKPRVVKDTNCSIF